METPAEKAPVKHSNEDTSEGASTSVGPRLAATEDDEPKQKIAKISEPDVKLELNPAYMTAAKVTQLKAKWGAMSKVDFKDETTGIDIFGEPFQICVLPSLLKDNQNTTHLVREMETQVDWSRKQMDLYEFYQSADLSNLGHLKYLSNFLQVLRRHVRPWLEHVTGLKLDYVSASCSMYTCGDYLLVHDDLLKDRQIAFVYYLSPWEGHEMWTPDHGGCLEIFKSDTVGFPQFPVKRKILPKNNQLVFFKVGTRSFHQVGEVTTFDYPRLTINGWFHGATNGDPFNLNTRTLTTPIFRHPVETELSPEECVNSIYLQAHTKRDIQTRMESTSEICLTNFLKRDLFEEISSDLRNDQGSLRWIRQGPANAQNYEVLDLRSAYNMVARLIALFISTKMFALLRDYTDLDLEGPDKIYPKISIELQRWTQGNYTILGDGAVSEENTLDLVLYINAADGAGVITYLCAEADAPPQDDEESVLLTITPVNNSLNMIYRCAGTTKFTKYVSRNTPMPDGPVYVLACSYKE